jgi:hypothetical protein
MATLKDTSALQSLNENEYINKLYGNSGDTQKQMLQDHYTQNTGSLNDAQQSVQQQTQTHMDRTDVEAERSANEYANGMGKNMSAGANAQAALTQDLTKKANVTELQNRQKQAEAEIERQRQLLGQQYAAAIKQAQAENDMQKAQALYDAAKKEDEQILAYKQQAAEMMATLNEDYSIYEELLGTGTSASLGATTGKAGRTSATPTWNEVLKNEQSINDIYNARMESQQQELLMDYQQALANLQSKQEESQRQTDTALNDAYVDSLKNAMNYRAVQGAYGHGSGTAAQANVAQDTGMLRELTRLRGLQTGTTAAQGLEGAEIGAAYRDAIAKANADNEAKRIAELISAAEKEEATLAEIQEMVGYKMAENEDYYLLGKLYGLTDAQIASLMEDSSSGSGDIGAAGISPASRLANLSNRDRQALKDAGLL